MKLVPLLLAFLAAAPLGWAASILTLSNSVAENAIITTPGNNVRSDWTGVTAFPIDAQESTAVDFKAVSFAHDSTRFFLRQEMFATDAGGFLSSSQRFFIDTDQNRSSGYLGPLGAFAVGAEYMLEGVTLYQFTGGGAQTSWSWNWLGSVTYDDWPLNDHEMSFGRALIGNPDAFDFIAATDFWGAGDNYPDSGLGGSGGGYYTYTTVPEPAALCLVALLGIPWSGRRR